MQLQYKELLQNISDWSWESDTQGTFTYCSDGIYDFLGYRADEIIGRTFFELLDSADKKKVSKKIDEISLSKKP
ncbi:MAG: PAS domain-containing protein, partial [Campylobacterota bacterium]|nr:PAS domain-containing protein [Campylobacterota bacterium]